MDDSVLSIHAFTLSGLILAFTSLVLVLLLSIHGKTAIHRIWILFNLSVAWWGIGVFLMGSSSNARHALLVTKIAYAGVIFIPVFFYHFSCVFSSINRKYVIAFAYAQAVFFCGLSLFGPARIPYISFVEKVGNSALFYLRSSGRLYDISLLLWISLVALGFFETVSQYLHETNSRRKNQFLYLFLGFFLGFLGGLTNFLPVYGINVVPIGNFTISFYCVISTYAILKYRLLDIKIAVTSASIFFTVYTLVLGIPVLVGFKTMGNGPWLLPVSLMAVLATIGPFVYLYIQKQAENRMLSEQRKYQATLRQASSGMGRVRDLKKLLHLIVFVLTRVVRIERVLVYFVDKDNAVARLNALRRVSISDNIPNTLPLGHPLLAYFASTFTPLAREELQQRMGSERVTDLVLLEQGMGELNAELVFPIFIRANLAAVVVLGKKLNGRIYSEDDLMVFSILANQASLAIENALSYENMKKTQEQLFKAEKMATIGTMADGLSHQINNRLHALGFIASDILDTVKLRRSLFNTPQLQSVADEIEHSLARIQDNVTRGGEIVQGLMKYTRKSDESVAACRIDDIVMTAREMAQFKIRSVEFKVIKEYDPATAPKVLGNFTQLQEVFFNLIDNAYDATVQRKAERKEEGYVPTLRISVREMGDVVEIVFSDNGAGVNELDKEKLFTPFFTTKATSKKGTGLGLYIIRKIIEENHGGKVEVRSALGQGTDMVLRLGISRA